VDSLSGVQAGRLERLVRSGVELGFGLRAGGEKAPLLVSGGGDQGDPAEVASSTVGQLLQAQIILSRSRPTAGFSAG